MVHPAIEMTSIILSDKSGNSSIIPSDSVIYTILDTGSSECLFPRDLAAAVYAAAGVRSDDSTGDIPLVVCNLSTADANFTFGFGGSDGPVISVPVNDLMYPE